MTRILYLSTLFLFLTLRLIGQPFFPISHPYGTKTVNGVNVTITPYGGTSLGSVTTSNCSLVVHYQDGVSGTTPDSGTHLFEFWPRIKSVRMNVYGFDYGDTIRVFRDGSKYNVTSSDIIGGICTYPPPIAAVGDICRPSSTTLPIMGEVVISTTTSFDSMRIIEPGHGSGGVAYDFAYGKPDTGVNIFEPFVDTAKCAGQNMYVAWASPYHFYSGNSFTIQLSEPNGSFNSFSVLGVVYSTDTYGVVNCPIPTTITPSADYRIRVVSTNPARMSQPNAATISIGVYPPKPVAISNSPLCESYTLNLDVNGAAINGMVYSWKGPMGWSGSQKNSQRTNAQLNYSGQYIVEVFSYGCAKSDTISVVVNPGPGVITGSTNSPVCFGDTLKLRSTAALPGSTYQWTGPAMPGSPGQNVDVYSVFVGGKYYITATLNSCSYTDTVTVDLKQKPATSAPFNNGPLCQDDTLRLNIGSTLGAIYVWKGPKDTFTIYNQTAYPIVVPKIQPAQAGKYYVYATSSDNCTSLDSTTVVLKPSPAATVASGTTPVCKNSRIYLYGSNATPGVSFSWEGPAGYHSTQQNPFINNIDFNRQGIYKLTTSLNGCISSDTTFIKVDPIPLPLAVTNDSICAGDTILISVTDTIPGTTFSWTGPDGYTSSAKDTMILHATTKQTGKYVVTSVSSVCSNTDTVYMLVKQMPDTPRATNNSIICAGKELQIKVDPVTPGANVTWAGPDGFTSKDPNIIIPACKQSDTGIYRALVDIVGCSLWDTTHVMIDPTPDLTITNNSPVAAGKSIEIKIPNHLSGTVYTWSGPNGFSSRAQNPIIFPATVAAAGRYIVKAQLGICEATDAVIITVNEVGDTGVFVFYPNPNNGRFTLFGLLKTDQKIKLQIFNATGQFIYEEQVEPVDKTLRANIVMPAVANGLYYLRFRVDGELQNIPFVIEQ